MNPPDSTLSGATRSDAELVVACLTGRRDAYTGIVERYQRLLCSLAYSATGSVSASEDIAQETFVTAWQQLRDLREPEKLRSWLCSILRFKLSHARRRDGRDPVHHAGALETADDVPASEEPAMNQAMQKEEQEILWTELARVPEVYREPLVLYYREHQSIEHVAAALDLSEDAVKQRLARGRRILQERVLAFVERALARSTPGRVFTLSVLMALPEIATPAKAVGVGAMAVQGGMMVKSTGLAALLVSFSGVANFILSMRLALDQAKTERERRTDVRCVIAGFVLPLTALALIYGLRAASYHWWDERAAFALAAQVIVIAGMVAGPVALLRIMRASRRMRSEERRAHPEAFADPRDHIGSLAGEYKSRLRLLGLPLVHVRFATPEEGSPPVTGWIALGDRAYGLIFAWGGIAVAPVSAGVFSIGLITVGGVGIGVIGMGTAAVGLVALGCVSVGVKAYAWLSALGWETATGGGFGIARLAAYAPIAFAEHANDPIALEILHNSDAHRDPMTFVIVITLLSMVPPLYYVGEVRRRLGRRAPQAQDLSR